MNNNREQFIEETKNRLQKASSELGVELNELQSQGLLSSLDRKKIMADTEISARAVRDALEKTEYPEAMQRELVTRLIMQFETSIKDIASKARNKGYDSKFVYQRFSEIEKNVLRNLGVSSSVQQKLETPDLGRIRESYAKRIKDLSKAKNFDAAQISYAYQDYESAYRNYASQFLPKIESKNAEKVAPSVRPVAPEERERPSTQNSYTPPVTPKSKVSSDNQRIKDFYRQQARPVKKSDIHYEENAEEVDNFDSPIPKRKASIRFAIIIAIVIVIILYACSFTAWLPRFIFHIFRFIF